MNGVRLLGVFLVATIMATMVAAAAAFLVWGLLPVQPGTATALATLFLVAPGIGIVCGIAAARRAVREPAGGEAGRREGGRRSGLRWLAAASAAVVGWLFGQGLSLVVLDLGYPHRLIEPGSALAWLSAIPTAAGLTAAAAMAWIVLARRGTAPRTGT